MVFLGICIGLILLEVTLVATVRWLRRDFQWLITEADELPRFDAVALEKFFNTSFDAQLGWTRRPNTQSTEKGAHGDIIFRIDATGSRARALPQSPEEISVFGDSYAFCRQVEDDQTWENVVSRKLNAGVANYGVGNYGVDQALMRYEQMKLPPSVRVAVLAFVPETICRIQCCWKHYLEFGNTFAFKPRHRLDSQGRLQLVECPVRGAEDVAGLQHRLADIQACDRFYRERFRALQFRRPYLLSLLRNPARHGHMLGLLILRKAARLVGLSSRGMEDAPFAAVMRRNIREAHQQYADGEATRLFRAILQHFAELAARRGHKPLVVVIPQLLDLKSDEAGVQLYQEFFRNAGSIVPVLDMTDVLRQHDSGTLYINDSYGGHLSVQGNALVGEHVATWLNRQSAEKAASR